jgi:hypothetical protein
MMVKYFRGVIRLRSKIVKELQNDPYINRESLMHSQYSQSDNMRMSAHLQNVNFSSNFLGHFHVFDLSFIQYFYCYFLPGDDMMRH